VIEREGTRARACRGGVGRAALRARNGGVGVVPGFGQLREQSAAPSAAGQD